MLRAVLLGVLITASMVLAGLVLAMAIVMALAPHVDPCDADGIYVCSQPPVPLQKDAPW